MIYCNNLIKRVLGGTVLCVLLMTPIMLVSIESVRAESIKVGLREFPAGKGNPFQGCVCSPAIFVWSAIYDQLARVDAEGQAVPILAESWEMKDSTTWHFKLRPGIKFSNGEPFNAASVKATYDFLKSDKGKTYSQARSLGKFVAETNVVNDLTVEIKTPKPDPLMSRYVTTQSILAPKDFADRGIEGITMAPVGTGPYVIKWNKGSETATAVANKSSWQSRANIDSIKFVVIEDPAARTQALISKQIDVTVQLGPDEFTQVEAAGMKVFKAPSTRTMGITLISHRNGKPVDDAMGDVRVRRALNYAVDKQAIIDNIFSGSGRPASQAAVPSAFGYNKAIKPYPYDPAKAKKLLAEAGYPDGKGLKLEVRAIVSSADFRMSYESAVQDLNKIGVKATLVAQNFGGTGGWLEHWIKGDWPYQGFGFGNDLTGHLDGAASFARHVSCTKPAPYYCNQDEMALLNKIYVEFDSAKRETMLREALKVNAQSAPIIYLVEFFEAMGHSPRIPDFHNVNLWIPWNELKVSG